MPFFKSWLSSQRIMLEGKSKFLSLFDILCFYYFPKCHSQPVGDYYMDIFSADYTRLMEVLKEHHYDEARVIPLVEKKIPGPSEILFWMNYHFLKKNIFFVPTFFTGYYQHHFKARKPHTFTLFKLFAQNKRVSAEELNAFLTRDDIDAFVKEKLLIKNNGYFKSRVRILPFFDMFILVDPYDRTITDYTYFGYDSVKFAEEVRSTLAADRFQRSLDIGTGSGVQALNVAHLSEEINGIDVNPRAIKFGQTNARINNITHANFFLSNLYEKVTGKFDLVTSNPPFVFYPDADYDPLTFRDGHGGKFGLELPSAILKGLDNILSDNGIAKMICISLMIKGHDTVLEEIRKIFSHKNYEITLKPFSYFMHPNYFTYHRKHGVAYNIFYIITLKKGRPYSLRIDKRNAVGKLSDFTSIGLLYIYFYLGRLLGYTSD